MVGVGDGWPCKMGNMPWFYLNSYSPLVASKAGREASRKHGLPPFVDGSIRREPDLKHAFPAISCLCRAGKFAPRLAKGDVVAYMTRKGRYGGGVPHRRLTAVLQVVHLFPSHEAAAAWYKQQELPLPNNCMVRGNPAKPLDHSHQIHRGSKCLGDARTHKEWDARYRKRKTQHPSVVVCQRLFHSLSLDAPVLEDDTLLKVFGKLPGTQNPGQWDLSHCDRLLKLLRLSVPPSAP